MAALCARSLLKQYLRSSAHQCRLVPAVRVGVPARLSGAPAAGAKAPRRMMCRAADGGGGSSGGSGKPVGSGGSGEPGKPSGSSGGLWAWYMACLESSPLLTKAVTCGLLNALGDIFCQLFIDGGALDWKRTATFTFMGVALVGPTLHYWYALLNRLVPARGAAGATLQLLLDQGGFAPVFLATFISVLFLIEGKGSMIRAKLEQDLVETIKVNWILWIPAQFFNFRFVPPNLQVLTANVVALAWNTYMSYQSHKAVAAPAGSQ
ncbi:PXMP2/4 family protein 2 [Tetrabaena socialis]|uniref:PXMP2/4 family protein 2 n=1 Tax=Tetrabaena socialis TaxID=47790 RepID=A0A2J8A157_9CHLO|nr:PXMP2/4 family protein 2 [Tetrabaena socialis]|eukprot:PNH06252.1 PXMP2/4 family protein 2 [Tetrabaena socialis]